MTKTKHTLTNETVLLRPLFLILIVLFLLMVPAAAFAESDAAPAAGDCGTHDLAGGIGEPITAGTFDSPAVFDQGPTFDFAGPDINNTGNSPAVFDKCPTAKFDSPETTTTASDYSPAVFDQDSAVSFDSAETTFTADTSSFDSNTPTYAPPATEDSPAFENPSSSSGEQEMPAPDGQQTDAEQNGFESYLSPDCDFSAPAAFENTVTAPLYFMVEQVSMSPLLNPGNIIELLSAEYADGDLVVAQLADGTHVVKMLQGDLLTPLGAGVSYSTADLTILGKAELSALTAAELEAGGLSWSSVLAETSAAPSLLDPGAPNSPDNPYLIGLLTELYWIAEDSGRWNSDYRQTANIDASTTSTWFSGAGWLPIGTLDDPFEGSYNGGGYIISGLFINRPAAPGTGLFGFTGPAAKLSNISLEDVNFTSTNVEGTVGGLVGGHEGEIINSYVTGSITGINYVGGLVGANDGTITNSYATGTVTGEEYVGGLVGQNKEGTIENCYATGDVTQTGGNSEAGGDIGGLVGYNDKGTIINSYATGHVTGVDYVGGLVGTNEYGTITNSYAVGNVTGESFVGGLVGWNQNGVITNCYWNTDSSTFPGIGGGDTLGATGKTAAEMKTLAFHQTTLGWGGTIATTTATVDRGGYNPYPFPRLFWELGNVNPVIWYIYVRGEEGGSGGGFEGISFTMPLYSSFYSGFEGISFRMPLLPPGSVLTNIPRQTVNAIITPAFITGGSTADLNRAIAAYNQAQRSYTANYGSMGAKEKAVAEVELAIASAAIKALELRLALQKGQAVDIAALVAAYQAARAALNSNRGLLTADQVAEAQALLDAIASMLGSLRA